MDYISYSRLGEGYKLFACIYVGFSASKIFEKQMGFVQEQKHTTNHVLSYRLPKSPTKQQKKTAKKLENTLHKLICRL